MLCCCMKLQGSILQNKGQTGVQHAEMLEEILHEDQMQQLSFADTSALLQTCLLECPDRDYAIKLLHTIKSIISPGDDAKNALTGTKGVAACSDLPKPSRHSQRDAVMAYTLVSHCLN